MMSKKVQKPCSFPPNNISYSHFTLFLLLVPYISRGGNGNMRNCKKFLSSEKQKRKYITLYKLYFKQNTIKTKNKFYLSLNVFSTFHFKSV